nr:recombinase family protein [Sinorhizobium sp. A49]
MYGIISKLDGKGITFEVLDGAAVDTSSRTGKFVLGILAMIAEFETGSGRNVEWKGSRGRRRGRDDGGFNFRFAFLHPCGSPSLQV